MDMTAAPIMANVNPTASPADVFLSSPPFSPIRPPVGPAVVGMEPAPVAVVVGTHGQKSSTEGGQNGPIGMKSPNPPLSGKIQVRESVSLSTKPGCKFESMTCDELKTSGSGVGVTSDVEQLGPTEPMKVTSSPMVFPMIVKFWTTAAAIA